jgi:hypothetical protein
MDMAYPDTTTDRPFGAQIGKSWTRAHGAAP